MRRAHGPQPERALEHIGLEDRLNDDLGGRLHNAVADRGDRERTPLPRPARLRNEHSACRKRTPAPVPRLCGQLIKKQGNAVLLDSGDWTSPGFEDT